MLVEFTANAYHLHRASTRMATRLAQSLETDDDFVHFDLSSGRLEISIEGASANLHAEVRRTGAAFVPLTVLAGMVHVLPYFGNKPVEVGFSPGKMRVDTTIFHNRNIVLSMPASSGQRRAPLREGASQLA